MEKVNASMGRRAFLQAATAACSLAYAQMILGTPRRMRSDLTQTAERLIIVYHPDGVFLDSWHPQQREGSIGELPESLLPLAPYRDQLLLFRNLSLLDGIGDGHEESSRCLLTGSKDPAAGSLDVLLANSLQQALLHVGVLSSKAQGHSVSFTPGGAELVADDSPLAVYQRLFPEAGAGVGKQDTELLKIVEKELQSYIAKIDLPGEKIKLEQHLKQVQILASSQGACGGYDLTPFAYQDSMKWEDHSTPLILKMQIYNMIEAMACGLSRVGTLQISRHTSPLKMDFDWLGSWNNTYPMESHQASHNSGATHAQQKKWFNLQLTSLFRLLANRAEPNPERQGSMLDHSLVVVVTEIAQGASHTRKDMPFYIVGGAGLQNYRPGRIIDCNEASHAQLLFSLSQLLGQTPQGSYANAGALRDFIV